MCSLRDVNFWKEFFSLYKHYPELWKVKSEAYKNRMLKRRAYAHLLEKYKEYEPDATEDTLKRRINNFRVCYRRELHKVNKSYESGCRGEDLYTPNLWYFNDLNFLRHQEETEPKENITSLEIETNFMHSDSNLFLDVQNPVATTEDYNCKKESEKLYDKTGNENGIPNYSLPTSKKIATEKAIEDLKLICKQLSQSTEEDDEFTCFGLSVASQLKKLPEKIAQESMDNIQSFLVRQRLKLINNPNLETISNKKRKLSEGSNYFHEYSQDKPDSETSAIAKQIKEKEMEFLEAEHNEKVQIWNLEKQKLKNKLKYDEEEHMLKMQQLQVFQSKQFLVETEPLQN